VSVWTTAGIFADGTFDDPENARIIYLAAGGLLLVAVALGVGTWMWWRNAKVEHPALGPLEVMGSRRWWRSDFNDRRRRLDAARPAHETDDVADEAAAAAHIDLESVMTRDDPQNFDDLLDPDAAVPAPEAAPVVEPVAAPAPEAVEAVEEPKAAADEPEADAVVDAEVVDAAEEPFAEPVAEPVAEAAEEPEQLELVAIAEAVPPRPTIITVDTAPKRTEAVDEAADEAVDADPTPVPIDPLLRLQID
jgi:hypothetical protein